MSRERCVVCDAFVDTVRMKDCPHIDCPLPNQKAQRASEPALRYDAGKLRYDLLPSDALASLVEVYTKGAAKYADRNWEKGMSWSRCFGSLMRHCWAFWRGEQNDPETGCHHMAMAAWNCFALVSYSLRTVGKDDRPIGGAQ
jgi:hypothetical protein